MTGDRHGRNGKIVPALPTTCSETRRSIGSDANFQNELTKLINKMSAERGSDTPDFILGQFLANSLAAFDQATNSRDKSKKSAPVKKFSRGDVKCCHEAIFINADSTGDRIAAIGFDCIEHGLTLKNSLMPVSKNQAVEKEHREDPRPGEIWSARSISGVNFWIVKVIEEKVHDSYLCTVLDTDDSNTPIGSMSIFCLGNAKKIA